MLVAQLTDTHIVEAGERLYDKVDTASMLEAAVAHLNALSPRPDVVLATGDLVNDGLPAQYDELVRILAGLKAPLLAIPGNHDDRAGLRAALPGPAGLTHQQPATNDARIEGVIDDWPLRLIGLDTSVPGQNHGQVLADQMDWLDETLRAAPERQTLIFQHHPPFPTGIQWMDDYGLLDRHLEAEVVARHPQIVGVVCGHVHRVIVAPFAGTVASTWPSTGAQVALALDGSRYGYCDEQPAVALHRWTESEGLVSHVSYVNSADRWLPPWASPDLR